MLVSVNDREETLVSVVPVLVTALWEVAEVEPVVAVSVPVMLEPVVVCVSVRVVLE